MSPRERQEWEAEEDTEDLDYAYGVEFDSGVTVEQLALSAGIDLSDAWRDKDEY